jgi:hypothetical protein
MFHRQSFSSPPQAHLARLQVVLSGSCAFGVHAETQNDLARGGTELVRLRARARDQPVLEPGSWKREREREVPIAARALYRKGSRKSLVNALERLTGLL